MIWCGSVYNQIRVNIFLEPYMCHSFKLTSIGGVCRHMISAQAVCTADILTDHGKKSTCVINISIISHTLHCDGAAACKTP